MKLRKKHPKEFLITESVLSAQWYDTMAALLETLATLIGSLELPPPIEEGPALDLKKVAAVATGVWRLENNMLQPGSDRPREEMRRAYRHLATIKEILEEMGITIRDHTGEIIPERGVYQVEKIEYLPRPNLTRETVIETVKPSVFFRQERIQMGQVIIGTPPKNL